MIKNETIEKNYFNEINRNSLQLKYLKLQTSYNYNNYNNDAKHFYMFKKKSIFHLLLFILSYFLYYLSLEKCLNGFDVCGEKTKWIIIKLCEAILSYFILALLCEGMICKIISKIHFLHIIIVMD